MLKWIGNVLGGKSAELPDGVPQEWARRLQALVDPIDKLKDCSGTARNILSYVMSGEPVSVLYDAGKKPQIGECLRITGYHYGQKKNDQPGVYEHFDQVPVSVMLRWAKFMEACVDPNSTRSYAIQLPNNIHWPEILLFHASGCSVTGWSSERAIPRGLSLSGIEKLLIEAQMEASALLVATFATSVATTYGAENRLQMICSLADYSDAVDRHAEIVRPLLLAPIVAQRLHIATMLGNLKDATLLKFSPEVAELATSSSKQVRAASESLVRRCASNIVDSLKAIAEKGKPDQRLNALRLVWLLGKAGNDPALQLFANEAAAADKAPSIQALVSEWQSDNANSASDADRYEYDLPKIDWANALMPPVSALLDGLWEEINAAVEKSNKQMQDHYERQKSQGNTSYKPQFHKEYSGAELKSLKEYIGSPVTEIKSSRNNERRTNWQHVVPAMQRLSAQEPVKLVVILKVLAYFDLLSDNRKQLSHGGVSNAINVMYRARGTPGLLELSLALSDMGIASNAVLENYCYGWGDPVGKGWADESVWPFFAHNLDALVQLLNPSHAKDYWCDRRAVFRAVSTLPTPPAKAINAMFDLALGTGKSDRLPAQEALANLPGKEARIINALADGKAEVRTVAAQWLARLKHRNAVTALEAAVAKEKHDVPKGAMLDALELFGEPVEKYLDRNSLAAEAKKSLSKGIPKDLAWFPWAALPTVRWADTGDLVPTETLQWMFSQAVKQKSAEPNAVLRKYCTMFEPRDREAFGQFILEAWLAEDIKPITADEAMALARSSAQSMHASMQQYPQYYPNHPNLGKSVEEMTAAFLPGYLRQPVGSAIGSKGLLALSSACAGERAAAPVARYLKEYYGTRAAQGKALIAMLAWIEHPTATQLMLSIGNRFRTKSFQEEATRQAEALAERKGWTLDELADRTMPSAGFDETGVLQLSYGPRVFTAQLLQDFKVELFNPDGKKITALPEPRMDDDADLAKDAKKAFSGAKKEIKTIVDLQSNRLYEALCTGRDWLFDDWNRYLNQHPVVRRLAQRLVWNIVEDDKITGSFRPLDDGTLSDNNDNLISPPDNARIRVAHDSTLSPEQVRLWQQHLLDYEVTPLFQQFGKGTYVLPADKEKDREIKDFEGHLIEAFALRGRSFKLGYTRGAAEDGGWFHVYEKRFPTLGLLAVLEFTGNPLPEENRTVALLNMSFASTQGEAWQRPQIALSEIPKVLLSECYNDLRLIAADGAGFDSDWQKKTEY